jgi:1-carboxybiuret hydrolase subunit AtzG-like protein
MSETPFHADALIDASLPLLGLALPEDLRAGVKLHLETAERLSRLVLEFPLDDESEPAPVFTA